MEESTVNTTFRSGGKSIAAQVFQPRTPNGGVIVLAYGSDGMVDNQHGAWASMMSDYATALAAKGFTAMIPDYFQRTGTRPGDIDFRNGGAQQIGLHRDDWQAALQDALRYARGLPGIDSGRTGLLGFSLGGHLVLRLHAQAKVLVEFFAPVLDGLGPSGGGRVQAQIHHGDGDTLVPFMGNADRIDQALKAGGAVTDPHGYPGAGHGFVGTDAANTTARTLSKTRTLDFFESNL